MGLVKRPRTVETCGVRRRSPPALPPVTTVDIEGLLAQDDLRALLDACEHTGSIRAPEVSDIVETHELTGLEQEALVRELDKRGIEIVETAPEALPAPGRADPGRDDDGRPAAVPSRGGPASPPHRGPGGGARKADRARRRRREVADDPVEPATGRLDREELPQPGPPVPRPDPGGHARPHPRRREVRLAPWLQVLDLRDLVDPPGGRARTRRQGAARSGCRCTSSSGCRRSTGPSGRSGRSSGASRRSRRSPRRPRSRRSRSSRCVLRRARPRASTRPSATRTMPCSATSSPATSRSPRRRSRSRMRRQALRKRAGIAARAGA